MDEELSLFIRIFVSVIATITTILQTILQFDKVVERVIYNRKLLGIDMETYAVYYAAQNAMNSPKFVSIKAVSDYANQHKNDDYQKYAAFISIQFLLKKLDDILLLVQGK